MDFHLITVAVKEYLVKVGEGHGVSILRKNLFCLIATVLFCEQHRCKNNK